MDTPRPARHWTIMFVCVICVAALASSVRADSISWNAGNTGNYSDPANWDLSRAPIAGDDVAIAGTGSVANYNLTSRHKPASVTIGEGATLRRTMSSSADLRPSGNITNNGLFQEAGGGGQFLLYSQTIDNGSTGIVEARGSNANLNLLSTTINNDNIVRLADGALLPARNTVVNGGTFDIDSSSSMEITQQAQMSALTDVAVSNAGGVSIEQTGSPGERTTSLYLSGATSFNNETGATFSMNNTATTPDEQDDHAQTRIMDSAAFTNNGTITLRNESSLDEGFTAVSHTMLEVTSTTASLTNNGNLSIVDASAVATNEVWVSSVSNLSNSGDVTISGPQARLEVVGANYEQSTGSTVLADGASLIADTSNVSGGYLGGSGSVDGILNFADSAVARMSITGTGAAEYDQLTVNGDVAYDGTLQAVFAQEDLGRGYTFDLFDVTGSVTGNFDSLVDPNGFYSPDELSFDPGTGELTVAPEPGVLAMLGIALLFLFGKRPRSKA